MARTPKETDMNDTLAQRVRSAAIAGWWTLLIGAIWLTVGWAAILILLGAEPAWLLRLWGGHTNWQQVNDLILWMYAAFKLILFVAVLVTIWLSFWARRLRRLGDG